MVASTLNPPIGIRLASLLATNKSLQKFYGWYVSRKSDIPGRLYSFLAIKK